MASLPPLVLIGTAVLCLGNLLHMIGLGTTHWVDINTKKYYFAASNIGLFKVCQKSGTCGDNTNPGSTLEAVRALVIIGLLAGLLSAAIAILVILFKLLSKSLPKILTIFCPIAACCAFGLIIIGIIVYATDYFDSRLGSLGYSFGLSIVGALLLAAGGILFFVGAKSVNLHT